MALDVFQLRDDVVAEYKNYVESFVRITDERVDKFVRGKLAEGELWPPAFLQLNPAFVRGDSLRTLSNEGLIRPETARFFGPDLRLYRHQQEAFLAAKRGEPYVVTTGTGSGKSLAYLIPIVDQIFRNRPERASVRAVVVYPMNALINSQLKALEDFRERNWPDAPVRFDSYTGETKQDDRERILQHPPHLLLTNYVMLEYMMLRPYERALLRTATRELRFLSIDELHFLSGPAGRRRGHAPPPCPAGRWRQRADDRDQRHARHRGVAGSNAGRHRQEHRPASRLRDPGRERDRRDAGTGDHRPVPGRT